MLFRQFHVGVSFLLLTLFPIKSFQQFIYILVDEIINQAHRIYFHFVVEIEGSPKKMMGRIGDEKLSWRGYWSTYSEQHSATFPFQIEFLFRNVLRFDIVFSHQGK